MILPTDRFLPKILEKDMMNYLFSLSLQPLSSIEDEIRVDLDELEGMLG